MRLAELEAGEDAAWDALVASPEHAAYEQARDALLLAGHVDGPEFERFAVAQRAYHLGPLFLAFFRARAALLEAQA